MQRLTRYDKVILSVNLVKKDMMKRLKQGLLAIVIALFITAFASAQYDSVDSTGTTYTPYDASGSTITREDPINIDVDVNRIPYLSSRLPFESDRRGFCDPIDYEPQ